MPAMRMVSLRKEVSSYRRTQQPMTCVPQFVRRVVRADELTVPKHGQGEVRHPAVTEQPAHAGRGMLPVRGRIREVVVDGVDRFVKLDATRVDEKPETVVLSDGDDDDAACFVRSRLQGVISGQDESQARETAHGGAHILFRDFAAFAKQRLGGEHLWRDALRIADLDALDREPLVSVGRDRARCKPDSKPEFAGS